MIYVDRDGMEKDKLMPKTKCFSAIVKMDMRVLDSAFFSIAKDSECNAALYETNYNKEIDKTMKQVATTYTSDIRLVNFSLPLQLSECKYESFVNYICLTSLTRAKCGTRSTLCWKILNISDSTELFAL